MWKNNPHLWSLQNLLNFSLYFNKSSSLPAFVPEGSQGVINAKPHRRRLQELENEVNKSRMAIVLVGLVRKTWVTPELSKVDST